MCPGRHFLPTIIVSCSLGLATEGFAKQGKPVAPKEDQTHYGTVVGGVYDAVTGRPISSAVINGHTAAGYAETGRSIAASDQNGRYQIGLILGRASTTVAGERLLLNGIGGFLFGSNEKQSKQIDVSKVAVKVTAEGYKPFRGSVESRRQDSGKFKIFLNPVLLMPEGASGVSITDPGFNPVRLKDHQVSSKVALAGDTVTISTKAWVGSAEVATGTEVFAISEFWRWGVKLTPNGTVDADGWQKYELSYKVTGAEKFKANRVQFEVRKSPLDFSTSPARGSVFLHMSKTAPDMATVEDRDQALKLFESGKYAEAYAKLSNHIENYKGELYDSRLAGMAAYMAGMYLEAKRALVYQVKYERFLKTYTQAYMESCHRSGLYGEILANHMNILELDMEDTRKECTPEMIGYLGKALISDKQYGRSDRPTFRLNGLLSHGYSPIARSFRAEAAIVRFDYLKSRKENPSPLMVSNGLIDLGKYNEAEKLLSELKATGSTEPGITRDLVWIALKTAPEKVTDKDLVLAINDARANSIKGKEKNQAFLEVYRGGMLEVILAERYRLAGNAKAAEALLSARDALKACLPLGRNAAIEDDGFFPLFGIGFVDPGQVFASGFSYPEANGSFMIAEAIKRLAVDPNDEVALVNIATSYHALGFEDIALDYLARAEKAMPGYLDAMVLRAHIDMVAKRESAGARLEDLKKVAPNHPRVTAASAPTP